jgi:hypothetical protein
MQSISTFTRKYKSNAYFKNINYMYAEIMTTKKPHIKTSVIKPRSSSTACNDLLGILT